MMVKFKAGDVIMDSQALVHVVKEDEKGNVCDFCLKASSELRRCSKCKEMFYCSRECQKKDWAHVHKLRECELLGQQLAKSCENLELDIYRLLLRFVLKARYDTQCLTIKYLLFDGRERTVEDVMDHVSKLKLDDPDRLVPLQLAARQMVNLGVDVDEDTIVRRASQLFVNAFGILDETIERKLSAKSYEVALGLFIEGSSLDHSCRPNAGQVYIGTKMQIRALQDVDTELEPVVTSYVDLMMARTRRMSKLMRSYFFECNCSQCSTEVFDNDYEQFELLKKTYQESNEEDRYLDAYEAVTRMEPILINCLGTYSLWRTEIAWLRVQFKLLYIKKFGDNLLDIEVVNLWKKFLDNVLVTHGPSHEICKSTLFEEVRRMFEEAEKNGSSLNTLSVDTS